MKKKIKFVCTKHTLTARVGSIQFSLPMTDAVKEFMKNVNFFELEDTEETEKLLLPLLSDNPEEFIELKAKNEAYESLLKDDRFYKEGNSIYMKGIDAAIPRELLEIFLKGVEQKWVNFWYWAAQSNPESRERIFGFMSTNDLTVLPNGLLLCGRRVVGKNNSALQDWANEKYWSQKKNKKSTNCQVYQQEGKYNLTAGTPVGILKDIVTNTAYTSWYDNTVQYFVGKENRMPREKVEPNVDAHGGYGFYVGGKKFCFQGYGSVPVLALVNPKDICSVMEGNKMRVCAWTFIAVLESDLKDIDSQEVHDAVLKGCKEYEHEAIKDTKVNALYNIEPVFKRDTLKTLLSEWK